MYFIKLILNLIINYLIMIFFFCYYKGALIDDEEHYLSPNLVNSLYTAGNLNIFSTSYNVLKS